MRNETRNEDRQRDDRTSMERFKMRDAFALAAMHALIVDGADGAMGLKESERGRLADASYDIADTMLATRAARREAYLKAHPEEAAAKYRENAGNR